jgi:signal transduction histidine kinase
VVSLIAFAVLVAGVAEWLFYQRLATWLSEPGLAAALDAMVGLSFAGIGLATWRGRPDSWTGRWLYLSGLVFFLGNFGSSEVVGVYHLGVALNSLWYVGLGASILTYPSGRFHHRPDLILVAVAFAWTVGFGAFTVSQLDPTACTVCPPNPFQVPMSADVVSALSTLGDVGGMGLWIVFALRVIDRWWRAAALERRALRPLWAAGLASAGLQVVNRLVESAGELLAATLLNVFIVVPMTVVVPIVLAYGLLRGRLDQASVGDLVVRLGDEGARLTLEASIAQALGDPSLILLVPTADGSFARLDGAAAPPLGPDRRSTVVAAGDEVIAVLVHDPTLDANPGLVRSVAAATRLALENERLTTQVQRQLAEVRASRARIVEASDASRARIERDLHDGAQQRLVTLDLRLRAIAESVGDQAVRSEIDGVADELDDALAELRELARGIHPTSVVQAGLASAVEALAERSTLRVRTDIPRRRWPIGIEVAGYFVIAEALTNAVRHADAQQADIAVREAGGNLVVSVVDDGAGGATIASGSGLAGLADRVAALGGDLHIDSPPGKGTTVRATLPLVAP